MRGQPTIGLPSLRGVARALVIFSFFLPLVFPKPAVGDFASQKPGNIVKTTANLPQSPEVKKVPTISFTIKEAEYIPPPPPQNVYSSSNSYPFGQCTYLVAQHRDIPWLANAKDWWWQAANYGFGRGQNPLVGSIMVSSEGNPLGHVALVTAVLDNNTWVVEEMNYYGVIGGGWGRVDFRTVSRLTTYLYGFIY